MTSTVKSILILLFWIVWAAWEWRVLQDPSVHSLAFKNVISINEIRATLFHRLNIKVYEERQQVLLSITSPDVHPPASSFRDNVNIEQLPYDEQARHELSRVIPRPGLLILDQCLVFSTATWSCDLTGNQLDALFPTGAISMQDGRWVNINNVFTWRTLELYAYFECPNGVCDLRPTDEIRALLDQFVRD